MADYSHGVAYTPALIKLAKALLPKDLASLGIAYVRISWLDLTSVVRERIVPISSFLKLVKSSRPGITMTKAALGIIYLNVAEGFDAIGEYLFALDLDTLRRCPYEEDFACVTGWFQEKAPQPNVGGVKVDLCPRTILSQVLADAKSKAGVEFLVGFETEFILLKSTKPLTPLNVHNWSAAEGLRPGTVEARVLREMVDGIQRSGIEIDMYHAEAAPGQYEIVASPLTPLQAADALVLVRETIRSVASKHGLRATFAPRLYENSTGSAAHAHISVHSSRGPPKPKSTLSSEESSFLSGVLNHIPAITAISLPLSASYKRVLDGVWSGGTYVSWGTESREAPIRLTNAASPNSRRFELRFLDGTCNPHLALAAILGAGSRAVQAKEKLTIKDCGTTVAAQMSEEERQKMGVTQRLSLSWDEARQNFAKDGVMRDVFGQNFVEKYLSVNKTLMESLADQDSEAEITRLVEYY